MKNKKEKIVISSQEKSLESEMDSHFGRCAYFVVFEVEENKIISSEIIKNEAVNLGHGAGTSAVDALVKIKANTVISGNFGPRAEEALTQLGIKMIKKTGIVNNVINEYLKNEI